ncbi:hypothetical protein [Saccharothrix syringae]|uniref:Uncharacterized protein n=1 Tax=Saccharothrix syringae TaxID=103733 RepID=A0A5Q0H777_SACSY|nr:hypothetical protein [Saccharothrix syringae]QFZ21813.1 hypothetical protein EKG83_34365 [Saccharothrix syringae]
MTAHALYLPEDRELDLSSLSAADHLLISSLVGRIGPGDRVLVCLEPDDAEQDEMYVEERFGRYYAVHFEGGQHVVALESDEHKLQKEYWHRAAEDAGFRSDTGLGTGTGTVLDVAIHGPTRTGVELRRADVTARAAALSTTGAHRAGWLPLWFSDSDRTPKWFHRIPSVGCNRISWDDLPPRRSATATGLRLVHAAKCTAENFPRCFDRRRRPCGDYHPLLRPWRGVTVDDVAEMVPAGEAVPLQTPERWVYVVPRLGLAHYQQLTEGLGAYQPEKVAPVERRDPPRARAGAWPTCRRCGRQMFLVREGRELCENCKPMMRDPV